MGVFREVFPVQFRDQGVDLRELGIISLLGLAWTLKFLWAPAVDYFRHHRWWIFLMNLSMGGVLLFFVLNFGFGVWVWVAIGTFAVFSATNDIAIDGYTIELLEKNELGLANGIRNGMYRVGMLAAGVVLILSDYLSWSGAYLAGAGLFCLCGIACLMAPKEKPFDTRSDRTIKAEWILLIQHPFALAMVYLFLLGAVRLVDMRLKFSAGIPWLWPALICVAGIFFLINRTGNRTLNHSKEGWREELNKGPMFGALFEMIQRPFIIPVIFFVLLYKLADSSMGFMVRPFWLDVGFSKTEIGLITVFLSAFVTFAGGLAGGWFTDRYGILKGIWVLGILQAFSNLGYGVVAYALPTGAEASVLTMSDKWMMYGASVIESFTGGLGSAAFMAFLMAIVNKKRSASEYALLSALFGLSASVAGFASGFGAQAMGYGPYFVLTFFLAFPAYLFLPWVKRMMEYTQNWD